MMRRIRNFLVSLLALSGLLMAMSENPYFPWPNLAGICVMAAIALLAQRDEGRGDVRSRIDDQITRRLREIDRENFRRARLLRYRTRTHG